MPLFNIITALFTTSRTFAFYGGFLPLIRVCMPFSDESGWYIKYFYVLCATGYTSVDNTSITIYITITYCLASICVVMDQFSFMQSCRRINYHDDIVLRTPTISFGERLLDVFMKDQSFDGSSILEVKYPKCEKDIQDIMEEL